MLLTSSIVLAIIICCTIIILGTISVSIYRIYKGQQKDLGSYIFSASVLSILAIAVFSFCFYENRNVLDFVSLSSALISIILAVITIIYSFYSNSRSAGQIETLNNAAKSVEKATSSYSESAESLQENIQKIIFAITRVEEKTDRLLGVKSALNTGENNHLIANFDLEAYVKGFVDSASPLGIMATYACIKSKDTNKMCNLNIFPDESNNSYCGGFLIAITSTGFITADIDFSSGNIKVHTYLPIIKQHIESWIEAFDFSQINGLLELKNNIDDYFKETK